jgi:protein O-mannosyl-transferase
LATRPVPVYLPGVQRGGFPWRDERLLDVGLLVGTALLFLRVVSFGFAYDDHWTIQENTWLEQPLGAILRAAFDGSGVRQNIPDITRPAMLASVWVDHRIFGWAPAGYHLQSVLLYLAVVLTARRLLSRLGLPLAIAFICSACFAVMPIHAEVAAAINYREDLLSALGVMLPLLALVSRDRRWHTGWRGMGVCAVWLVGLLAKESALCLALALPLVVAWLGKRWYRRREDVLLGLVAVLVCWLGWRLGVRVHGEPLPTASASWSERWALGGYFIPVSVLGPLAPWTWSPDHAPIRHVNAWWALAVPGTLVALAMGLRWRCLRVPVAGAIASLLASVMHSPLVGPANFWADRFGLLPSLGSSVVLVTVVLVAARAAGPAVLRVIPFALGVFCLWAGAECSRALACWKSDGTLWSMATQRAPDSPRAWQAYAEELARQGRLTDARRAIERSLALNPSRVFTRVTLLQLQIRRGEIDEARSTLAALDAEGASNARGVSRARLCLEPPRDPQACSEL